MNEITFRNDSLGLTMTKVQINGIDAVWAENVREALEWGRTIDMVRGLKEGKEFLKVSISNLDSGFNDLISNLHLNQTGRGRQLQYAYFLTRQGVARLIATRRPHDIKDNPGLAQRLDRLQDWIFGEVLPEVLATGRYSGRPLVAGQHAIEEMPTKLSDALRLMADEYDAHELTIGALDEAERTKAQINNAKTATAMQTASVLSRQVNTLSQLNRVLQLDSDALKHWRSGVGRPRKGSSPDDDARQLSLL